MHIKTFKPNTPILNKYIEYYYEATLENESYFAFPHYNQPTILSENIKIQCTDNKAYLTQSFNNEKRFVIANRFKKPIEIIVKGKIKEFCIIFKPYGLTQFEDIPLQKKIKETLSLNTIFNDFLETYPLFFEWEIEAKINTIDTYLLSKLKETNDIDIVIRAIHLIKTQRISIKEIAFECMCSSKKLSRLFQKICGESPITYKKIIAFRMVLDKIKGKNPDLKISDIAIDTGYYDQPYFNNVFKKLTKEKPKDFFKKVSSISGEKIYFKMVK